MRFLTCAIGAITAALALGAAPVKADTFIALIELHDYERGHDMVREFFRTQHADARPLLYQSAGCAGGDDLYANAAGVRDEKPVEIERISLLGDPARAGHSPVYLVAGARSIWIRDTFVDLHCTWLVSFNGNTVRRVREAGDLYYLIESDERRSPISE